MTKAKRFAELESEQAAREVAIARAVAALRCAQAELASLRVGVAFKGELTLPARTEPILGILRAKASPLSPRKLFQALSPRAVQTTVDRQQRR
jgi:hypothetical protein